MDFETVIATTYPHEAYVIKTVLESHNIHVQIRDELTVQVNNFYSNAIGGVRVLVPSDEVNKANEVLVKGGFIQTPDQPKWITRSIEKSQWDKLNCPFCQSEDFSQDKDPSGWVVIIYYLAGIILPIFKYNRYRCFNCSSKWKLIK